MQRAKVTRFVVLIAMFAATLAIGSTQATAVVPGRDGKVAFARQNQVYTINSNGSALRKLTSAGKNYWPRWSPDRKRIAYVNEAAGVRNIWVMNANGSSKRQVTRIGALFGAAWSPDGRWLA